MEEDPNKLDEKERKFLERLMKNLVTSMFEAPIKGKDCINGSKVALDWKIEDHMHKHLNKGD